MSLQVSCRGVRSTTTRIFTSKHFVLFLFGSLIRRLYHQGRMSWIFGHRIVAWMNMHGDLVIRNAMLNVAEKKFQRFSKVVGHV